MSNGTYTWYILDDVGPTEFEFRDALLAVNKEPRWRRYVKDAVVPTVTGTEMKNGKRVPVQRVYQTGRVLAHLADSKILSKIQSNAYDRPTAFKSLHSLNPQGFRLDAYRPISDEIAGRYYGVGVKARPLPSSAADLDYAVGDRVQVIGGAFQDQTGPVKSLNFESGEVTVSITIFGRTQHVETYFDQVKPTS
ncbi:MAG: hypothetical protein AAFQ27_09625 [Pseudomonadota bacterium]